MRFGGAPALLLLSLLQLGSSAALPASPRAASLGDTIAGKKLLDRAMRAELNLFNDWRNEWLNLRDLKPTYMRFGSLHCHYDDYEPSDIRLIRNTQSRKSMCPIWFEQGGTRGDASRNIDLPLKERSRDKIRAKRSAVLRLFDSLAAIRPRDAWVLGQRVRLNVDQRDFIRAADVVANDCHESRAACAMLDGFIAASSDDWSAAATAYDFALGAMTPTERCAYLDVSLLLAPADRDRYLALPCPRRDSIATTYWWLADPLFVQPGNERLYVHLYRQTFVALHSALVNDEHYDWRPRFGGWAAVEMIIRYGPPSVSFFHRQEHENHNGWLGFGDHTVNASREYFAPRFHTTAPMDVANGTRALGAHDFNNLSAAWDAEHRTWDDDWWPFEHFARAGALAPMRFQAAAFRRSHAPLLAVVADPRSSIFAPPSLTPYSAVLLTARSPTDSMAASSQPARVQSGGAVPMTLLARPGEQIVAAEIMRQDDDSAAAARARFPITLPYGLDSLRRGDLALSDPALFAAPATDDSLPASVDAAIERMLPTTELTNRPRVGVFVELYGVARGDPVELTLTIYSEDQPGFFRRLGARLGIADAGGGSVVVRWRDDQPGSVSSATSIGDIALQSRAIVLNIASLKSGSYALEIGAGRPRESVVISRREFSVRR